MSSEKKGCDCSVLCFICSLGIFGIFGSYSFPNIDDLINYKDHGVYAVNVFINNFSYVNYTNEIELTFYGRVDNNITRPIFKDEYNKNYTFLIKDNNEKTLKSDFNKKISEFMYKNKNYYSDSINIYMNYDYENEPSLNVLCFVMMILSSICGVVSFCCCCIC